MGFETPKFNKKEEVKTPEKKEREMTPEEAEKMLGEMDEYTEGLKALLAEKQVALEQAKKSEDAKQIEALEAEVEEIQAQIPELEEFSEEGKEEGAQFKITQ